MKCYLVYDSIPVDEYNHDVPVMVFMEEEKAKQFIKGKPCYDIVELPFVEQQTIVIISEIN